MLSPTNRAGFIASSLGALAVAGSLPAGAAALAEFPPVPLPPEDLRADADMRRVLQQLANFHAPRLPQVIPQVARELPSFADALRATLSLEGKPCVEPVGEILHRVIAGPRGQLLLRFYVPDGIARPAPIALYFHGGGFVIADLDTYDASPRSLANGSGAVIVSVAYRQAPEYPFPAAPDDAFAAYRWLLDNAASLGGDPERIAVTGESAGGNLATVVAIRARDEKLPLPVHQVLVYPVTTFTGSLPPSYLENPTTIPLATPDLAFFKKYYLPSAADAASPLASPLLANLRGLPPATIINADIDPLRDNGAQYAAALKAAGVKVTRTVYAGVTHEFFGMGAAVAKARLAMAQATAALRQSFGT